MYHKATFFLIITLFTRCYWVSGQFRFETYALHKVHYVDVHAGKVIENKTIVIHQDRILGIYEANEFDGSDTVQVLDFTNHFVTPGLIDAHVHLGTDSSGSDNLADTQERLLHLLQSGVTTVRDMAGDARFLSYLSRQAVLDEISAPDIHFSALLAGPNFFKDPRTAAASQGYLPGQAPWMRAVTDDIDLDLIVAAAKGTGASGLKIYADLDARTVQRVVAAAHAQDMKVWAHATVFPARPSEVCRAGVDVMSHATYMAWEGEQEVPSDASFRARKHKVFNPDKKVFSDLARQMQSGQTILDATIALYQRYFPDSTLYQYAVAMTRKAYEHQVPIGVGTDMPIDINTSIPIFKEMQALQDDVGMQPMDILRGATIINAEMVGAENQIGSVEVGKLANLLLLQNNPAMDIAHLKNPKMVVKHGMMFKIK